MLLKIDNPLWIQYWAGRGPLRALGVNIHIGRDFDDAFEKLSTDEQKRVTLNILARVTTEFPAFAQGKTGNSYIYFEGDKNAQLRQRMELELEPRQPS